MPHILPDIINTTTNETLHLTVTKWANEIISDSGNYEGNKKD